MMSALIVCVVMVMISASGVIAQSNVRCYQCDSNAGDTWCLEPFKGPPANASASAYCNGAACSRTNGTVAGVAVGLRGCLSTAQGNTCYPQVLGYTNGLYCVCTGNLCNAATLSAASSSLVMTLAAATGVVLVIATRRHH